MTPNGLNKRDLENQHPKNDVCVNQHHQLPTNDNLIHCNSATYDKKSRQTTLDRATVAVIRWHIQVWAGYTK